MDHPEGSDRAHPFSLNFGEDEENIAKRTRTKHTLSDKQIEDLEALLVEPYEVELQSESEDEYLQFLQQLKSDILGTPLLSALSPLTPKNWT